jgi:hypothetical protein
MLENGIKNADNAINNKIQDRLIANIFALEKVYGMVEDL